MASRCASVDGTCHLPAPVPSLWPSRPTWLSPVGAAFEDDALTAALWASMSPPVGAAAAASSSASYCSASPSSSTTTTTTSSASAEILASSSARPGNGDGPARAALVGPTGRVSKRKPRPSRRAHTTYISADPADFRRMVQEITGYPVSGADAAAPSSSTPAPRFASAPACVLPTLDTSAFLLDSAAPQQQPERPKNKPTFVSPTMVTFLVADEASSLLQELEAMVNAPPAIASAFPTLESWGMI
ncbi:hypothetical protein GUJ93_ZPchr0001g29495 [Zizania palustris]|uniref:VQ domain-containing protein n=1 Tax=Zizania palustris TaxID=103762 RepID=A0A8J5V768_ZIZPA|nr:hypothetical protein GUJ93_ZPchr0001g29495 [Zizania palustris]